jgi:hypothetical protein
MGHVLLVQPSILLRQAWANLIDAGAAVPCGRVTEALVPHRSFEGAALRNSQI